MKNLKFLPHLSLIAVIVFLIIDTPFFILKAPLIATKNQIHAVEGSHQEDMKNKALTQEEKEKRMGIFNFHQAYPKV